MSEPDKRVRQSLAARTREVVRALLGVSAYEKPRGFGLDLDDYSVEQIREALGGQLQTPPDTKLRWYLADLEIAQHRADDGDLLEAGRLYRAMCRDGTLAGLMQTRAGGLVRLPKRFYGDAQIADELRAKNGSRSVFDEMFPMSELTLMARDGFTLGVSVAELVPVVDREYPVMVRLDPENLIYRWVENRWYFKSVAGLLPVTPGDGRWILHTPGARLAPWNAALWPAVGEAFINKQHAKFHRSNYSMKLANPARVAKTPMGAGEQQKKNFFRRLMAWGVNTVFDLPPGWEVALIESNGRGIEIFQKEIDTSDLEYMIAIAGQLTSTTGGTGFSNMELPRRIREDLIANDGDMLAYTLNTQGIPLYIAVRYGEEAIRTRWTALEWDTTTPKELEAEARTMGLVGTAIAQLSEVLSASDRKLDLDILMARFGVPLELPLEAVNDGDTGLTLVRENPDVAKALSSLVARLPPAARRLSIERLHELHQRRAA
jgi:hypothetical protein